jgi:DNA modification methylase
MDVRGIDRPPKPPESGVLDRLLADGVTWGDAREWLPAIPESTIDLFFMSPPYANLRDYARIDPDEYVEWFLPFAGAMLSALKPSGSFVLNIKDRVVNGERHPYVYELVLALRRQGWRWVETYIWVKPNAIPGRFGPRTKDSWEYVYWFAKGKPFFDVEAIRVPYRTASGERARRELDPSPRRNTAAGHGRKRSQTFRHGAADPGNVITVPLTYNQHYGVAHTAAMPEPLAEFFIKAGSPEGGVVIDPFAGGGTTSVVATRLGRRPGGVELHHDHVMEARRRLAAVQLQLDVPPVAELRRAG